ncbi:MAG: magnesium chelatase subunit D [Hyphomicrobiales bacterium]
MTELSSIEDDLSAHTKAQVWADALTASTLVALDPVTFGGLHVRAHAGPVRDALIAALRALLPPSMPFRKLPSHIADERLLGGLDMAATLKAGKPVTQRGLLSEAHGGLVLVPMAERMEALTASRLTAVLDTGEVALERDGITAQLPARLGVIALDEGLGDESLSHALADRLAFHADLTHLSIRDIVEPPIDADQVAAARNRIEAVSEDDRLFEVMTALATAFGVSSVRAILFAIRAARGLAALDERASVEDQDIELAARLVIAPRATRLPTEERPPEEQQPDQIPPEDHDDEPPLEPEDQPDSDTDDQPLPEDPLDDQVLDAVEAAIPAHLLEQLKLGAAMAKSNAQSASGKGAQQQALMRGRPIGSRCGRLDGRSKLHVVDTLRAAAPWQTLRRQSGTLSSRIAVASDDIRVRRFKQNEESVTIFLVDASGSAALHRLAEVKGAVEMMLAESYARRDYVALIVFRGDRAEMVLPPTRSLVRAKRCLAGVPGGGGTPLAAGLDAGLEVALECQRIGRSPRLVVMSDAQANVGHDPATGRAGAHADALGSAQRIARYRIAGLFIDTSPQRGGKRKQSPAPSKALEIANAMHAIHLALPHPNAAGLKDLIDGGLPKLQAS